MSVITYRMKAIFTVLEYSNTCSDQVFIVNITNCSPTTFIKCTVYIK